MNPKASPPLSIAALVLSSIGTVLSAYILDVFLTATPLDYAGLIGLAGVALGIFADKREGSNWINSTAIALGAVALLVGIIVWVMAFAFSGDA